ncbi:MAG: dTDP-4-dehydrorhamnose reductase [Coriobacteriales bacterium]|jgi:dTDP-4-dehydrorhamnose reductase
MRILLTGANGQLGHELSHILDDMNAEIGPLPKEYEGALLDKAGSQELDISDARAVDTWFASHAPYDLVLNCAALTNVDGCEDEEEHAFAVNANGPANLARACARSGARLVHVSTDYVFSGTEPGARKETDKTGPISAYGRSKLAGEEQVASLLPEHYIVRTAWLYGYHGKNFLKTMLRLGKTHESITVVNDQIGNPTSANDLAYEILKIALTDSFGIYHCTNEGSCSWADFSQAIMEEAGLACKVIPVTTEQYRAANPKSAKRPAYSSLENAHLATTIGNEMRPWREALKSYFSNMSSRQED